MEPFLVVFHPHKFSTSRPSFEQKLCNQEKGGSFTLNLFQVNPIYIFFPWHHLGLTNVCNGTFLWLNTNNIETPWQASSWGNTASRCLWITNKDKHRFIWCLLHMSEVTSHKAAIILAMWWSTEWTTKLKTDKSKLKSNCITLKDHLFTEDDNVFRPVSGKTCYAKTRKECFIWAVLHWSI